MFTAEASKEFNSNQYFYSGLVFETDFQCLTQRALWASKVLQRSSALVVLSVWLLLLCSNSRYEWDSRAKLPCFTQQKWQNCFKFCWNWDRDKSKWLLEKQEIFSLHCALWLLLIFAAWMSDRFFVLMDLFIWSKPSWPPRRRADF